MFLVTSCNTNFGMFLISEETYKVEKINGIETRGSCIDNENNIYVASSNTGYIFKFNKDFKIINHSPFFDYNIHSLNFYKNKLYAMDTYNDEIKIYNSKTLIVENIIKFKEDTYKKTAYHINDLFFKDENIYLTMFRDKIYDDVDDNIFDIKMKHGVGKMKVLNINDNFKTLGTDLIDNLTQPHSPYIYKDFYLCCNSRKNNIVIKNFKNKNFKQIINTSGFSRGICISNDILYVGINSSVNRKSTENSDDVDNNIINSFIEIFDFKTFKKIGKIDLPSDEIYNILKINQL